jgi:hypothetical protein
MGRHLNADAHAVDEATDSDFSPDEHDARHVIESDGELPQPGSSSLERPTGSDQGAEASEPRNPDE